MVFELERRTDPQRLDSLLDGAHTMLRDAESAIDRTRAVATLFVGLQHLRASVAPQTWKNLTRRAARHPILALLHEDPMARRCFEKPRGRADDPVVLDAMFRRSALQPVTPIGRAVRDVTLSRPTACALRHRRAWLGHQIDRAVERAHEQGHPPRVLAVGCGHLREANLCASVPAGAVDDFVALDGDGACVAVVESCGLPHTRVFECAPGALADVEPSALRDWLGRFDLVYAADAFETLQPRAARRLARALFDLLAPGGRLLFGNFLPTVPDSGFMEAFMGWSPSDRDLTTLTDLTVRIGDEEVDDRRVLRDPFGAIGYCLVDRAA